jgi:hypothetical protein
MPCQTIATRTLIIVAHTHALLPRAPDGVTHSKVQGKSVPLGYAAKTFSIVATGDGSQVAQATRELIFHNLPGEI